MRGVLFPGGNVATIREFPEPRPGKGQVVVRMKASGLCGSDVHGLYEAPARVPPPSFVGGHEPSGIVENVGEGVMRLRSGDRVMVHHNKGCGHCVQCLGGWFNACEGPPDERGSYGWGLNGGFADFMVAEERNCVTIPDDMSFEEGAMCTCGVGTAYFATRRMDVNGDDVVAILGCGPVGLAGIMIAKAYGAFVIAADTVDYRVKLAERLGADMVINAKEEDTVKKIKENTDGRGANVAIDYSGSSIGRNNAVEAAALWGRVAWIGENNDLPEMTLSPTHQMLGKQLRVYTSRTFGMVQLKEIPAFLKRHRIQLEIMITHRYPLESVKEGIEVFRTGETGKVIFVWK